MLCAHINDLFNKAKKEIRATLIKINKIDGSAKFGHFAAGMLEKYLFSCVIDADRYDTYAFMEGKQWKQNIDKSALWNELAYVLETKLKGYPKLSEIDLFREEVSVSCKNFGGNSTGIYQLSVPTGGGKTLSSLRYALAHAKQFNKDRIFILSPLLP